MASPRIGPTGAEAIYDVIRSEGGRVTVPMRTLVDVLVSTDDHLTADGLIAQVDQRTPGIAPSTTYRLLQRLEEIGVVEHVHTGRSAAIYHLREHGHVHLICHDCGAIIDIPQDVCDGLAATVRRDYDFTLEPRHSALLGRCGHCTSAHQDRRRDRSAGTHGHRHISPTNDPHPS